MLFSWWINKVVEMKWKLFQKNITENLNIKIVKACPNNQMIMILEHALKFS